MISSVLNPLTLMSFFGVIINFASVLACGVYWSKHGEISIQLFNKDYVWHSLLLMFLSVSLAVLIIIFCLSISRKENTNAAMRRRIIILLICLCLLLVMLSTTMETIYIINQDNNHNQRYKRMIAVLILTVILNIILILLIVISAIFSDRHRISDLSNPTTPFPNEMMPSRGYAYQHTNSKQISREKFTPEQRK